MDEDSAAQFLVFNHGPSSTTHGIHLVTSLPGKFDPLTPRHRYPSGNPSHPGPAQLKNSRALFREREMSGDFHIDVLLVPGLHLYNGPRADKRVYLFFIGSTFHSLSLVTELVLSSLNGLTLMTTLDDELPGCVRRSREKRVESPSTATLHRNPFQATSVIWIA